MGLGKLQKEIVHDNVDRRGRIRTEKKQQKKKQLRAEVDSLLVSSSVSGLYTFSTKYHPRCHRFSSAGVGSFFFGVLFSSVDCRLWCGVLALPRYFCFWHEEARSRIDQRGRKRYHHRLT